MRTDLAAWDRYFRLGLVTAAVILGLADTWTNGANIWIKSGFVITIAGLVGYFTNYLAIKMLFQPKRGQVLGWRGLVPRNQAQIARSLGQNVQQQLLSPDIILAYIRERQLVDIGTRNLADWVDRNLQRPEVRRQITELLIEFLNARGPTLLASGFDLTERSLKGVARNPRVLDSYWQKIRVELVDYLESEENREFVAGHARTLIQQQLPRIAAWLDNALDDYLSHRRTVGNLGRGLKNLISFDQDAIRDLLWRFSQDPRFTDEFMNILDAAMDGIQRELKADATQDIIYSQLENWVERLASVSRKTLLPSAIEQFDSYLNDERNWKQIEDALINSIQWSKDRALKMLDSPTGRDYLRSGIERAVQRLNVTELVEEQVMQLDTDELESMVLDNTGGNLTIIQILGGMLGIVAGTVQVHILFAIPIALLMVVVWVAYGLNERRHHGDS